MPATSRFRVSLGGLADAEHAAIRHLLVDGELNAAPQWNVTDEECQAIVVDPESDSAAAALGGRPFGSLVILALRPGEAAWPGTLSIVRPFDARQLDLTLNLAAQIISQPAFSGQAPLAPDYDDEGTSAELEESVEASTQEAPLFVEAVEEAAAIEESQAIEQEEDDAADPFDSPALSQTADDDALDRLAMAALGEAQLPDQTADDEAGHDGDDEATDGETPNDHAVHLHLHHDDDEEPVDLLSFPSPDDVDPLDIALAKVEKPEMFADDAASDPAAATSDAPPDEAEEETAEDLITSLDAAAEDLIEFDHAESHGERPGPFDDLIVRNEKAVKNEEDEEDEEPTPSFVAPVAPAESAGADEESAVADEEPAAPVAAASATSSSTASAGVPSEEMPEPTVALEDVDSLATLATAYREQLYRARHAVVTVGDDTFHLEPYTGSYYSSSPPETLSYFRGQDDVAIRIGTSDDPAESRPGDALRLVDFLWHLGFHAGDGSLLPWVDPEAHYRIMRQPPMSDDAKETGVLQIAQLLANSPVAAQDIARLAGADEITVTDFLNGCSLVGYLERVATPLRRGPRSVGARSRQSQASLIGNLRKRIGLSE